LSAPVKLSGIGLHTGAICEIELCPAPENHWYKFQRIDLENEPIIEASALNVSTTRRGTTLAKNGAEVNTVEHLLAALYASEVDNVLIKINGPEIPILDGSSKHFIEAVEATGITEQLAERNFIHIEETIPFEITEIEAEFLAVPTLGDEYRITVMVDYKSPVLGTQHASMYKLEDFKDEISGCRTFVFLKEVSALAQAGLIKGGDLDNALVLVEREYTKAEIKAILELVGKPDLEVKVEVGYLNSSKPIFQNEPARHKLLDIVGDLALTGKFIKGHILAARPGHHSNVEFAKKLIEYDRSKRGRFDIDLTKKPLYDINQITKMLPHRYPFLLVDKIMEMDEKEIIGVKNITMNEPFFTGHFPENPVMPGVLQLEAMAQVGGIFALSSLDDPEKYSTYFLKIDNVKFKQKVLPGDTIVFRLKLDSPIRRGLVNMSGVAYVNGKPVSEASMLAQIVKDK
jgi:UDP-3-O-[3-hydroxymyristoyl] N-acetylglucosamine deacetylase/3-hydroxyacyl-[acyl-carrier-protein] dehydratase